MSLTSDSVEIHFAGLQQAAGEEGTYRRGNESIDHLVAVPARTRYLDYGDEGLHASSLDKDWLFWAAELTKEGQRWTPQRGDQWDVRDADGVLHTFNVLPRQEGGRVFAPSDPAGQMIRVFMVETKARLE
jgi:hypothetical protein